MRLTDEILKSSDRCHLESFRQVFALAANGRFGLLPSDRDFSVSVSVNKNILDVESLDCLALTKSGRVIDIHYDTSFTNNTDTRITIPSVESSFILCVEADDSWVETNDGFCEPGFRFVLLQENTALSADMFPVARIVNEYGWRLDDTGFVPPCMYVASHPDYRSNLDEFAKIVKRSGKNLFDSLKCDCRTAIGVLWPIMEQLKIVVDKEAELMTPMMLLGNIQRYISGFSCACLLDDTLELLDADIYSNFVNLPYDYKDVNQRIKEGLGLCHAVCEKLEKFKEFERVVETTIEAPVIADSNLFKKCTNSKVKIPVENRASGATVYYTIDGSEPTVSSNSGTTIVFASGFVGGRDREEADKYVVIKVKAVLNGISSATNTYKVRLQKDVKHWIEI